ncbi:putative ribonuclease H-like domain-containing protein [Tanacetum coccineum]
MESLHVLFQRVVDAGLFKGIVLSPSLNISHLFYSDDAIFIGQLSQTNIDTITHVLECFHRASGIRINMIKSKLMGISVDISKVEQAAAKIGCVTLETLFNYLGLKVGGLMSRLQSWNEIIESIATRLSRWKLKTLSIGGRLTLLKSMLGMIPIYHMSIFKVPMKVLQRMESIRSRSLGVSSLFALNRALMFKWVWHFISQSSSLWARVIKALHGEDGKIGKKFKSTYPSIWLNIIHEVELLKLQGIDLLSFIHSKLGNGANTSFWEVAWRGDSAFKDLFPRIRIPRGGVEQAQFDLLKEKVEGCVLVDMFDRWVWSLEGSGDFMVSSVRKLIDDVLLPEVTTKTRWIKAVPIKVNVHAWKVKLNCLTTRFNISRREEQTNPVIHLHPTKLNMSGSQDEIPPPPPPPPSSSQTPTQQTPHTVSTIKLPILKKGEYDIWAMKMEHYLAHTDYPIWEVIQNGNGPVSITTDTQGQIKVLPPRTAEEIVARERERKARTTLLMALPEDHLAKFHKMTDAKEMWDAIKSRFGGNDESKKMQKYILKQQFEGFSVSNSEGLHKGYDRFQSLLSQLEIHGAGVSTEDANQKFLRSLPSAWSQVSLIMRTKPGVDSLSFDDLYNNLRVFENDVKGSTASSSSTQNVAFVSENTSSTNDVSTAYSASNPSGQNSQYEQTSSYSLLANQSSCPQLDHEDLEQLDEYDLEEMDLKWQVAMISMRMKKFYKKTGRKLQFDAKEPVGFDKTKVECYNCHKTGHFARECRIKGNQDNRRRDAWNSGNKDGSRTGKKEDSKALVTIDGEGVDWTSHSEEDEDYALMACNSSESDTEVTSCSNECKESYAKLKKLYDAQREQLSDASIEIKAYTQGLKKVEAQLVAHQQGQLWYEQKIKFMKIDLDDKTDVLTYHKKLLAEAQKEKEDLKAKVEKWHNSLKNLSKLLNTQMSANDKFGLGYGDHRYDGILSYENEVLQSVFMNKESELEKQHLYDRFVIARRMHVIPPPMTGNYMPSGPDIEVDYSQFTYGPKQTQPSESKTQTSEFDTCESNISTEPSELVSEPVVNESNVECQPKVWSDAPIIEEYESDSEDEYVTIPTNEQETPSFANQQVKTPRETVKNQFTHSQKTKVDKKELGYGFTTRACFVCGSLNHLIKDCDFHEKRMAKKAELNNGLNRNSTQREKGPIWNNDKTNLFLQQQAVLTSTAMKVNTVKPIVNRVRPANVFHKTHSPSSRPFKKTTVLRTNFSKQKVNTAKVNAVSSVGGKRETAVKPSAGIKEIVDKWDVQDHDGKNRLTLLNIKTLMVALLLLEHFNLFSVSQMCDKKNKVLFTDSECLVLSPEFKLPDENQVLLRIPRQNNMYSFNLENIVPSGGLACLIAKATIDESNKWHRRFFKMATLVLLVRKEIANKGPPVCKSVSSISHSLQLLHMDLFGPTSVRSLNHKTYCLNSKIKEVIELRGSKGIKRKYSNVRTPQQNGVAERKNRTFIEAARTMLADSFLPITFWAGCKNPANKHVGPQEANPNAGTKDIIDAGDSEKEDESAQDCFRQGKKDANNEAEALRKEFTQETENLLIQAGAAKASSTNIVNTVSTPAKASMADFTNLETVVNVSPIPTSRIISFHPSALIFGDPNSVVQTRSKVNKSSRAHAFVSFFQKQRIAAVKIQKFKILIDLHYGKMAIGTKWFIEIKRLRGGVVVQKLIAKCLPYDKIDEEVYVSQPPGFLDPKYPQKVYKVVKALYGLHQAPRAWYATLSTFLLKNGYRRGTIDKTLFIKKDKHDIILVQVYVDDIIFGSTKKSWCDEFEALMKSRFQMSSMGELTFFLGLQVKQKADGIFISQDKYVAEILKKFDFANVKTASTPIETQKPLVKDEEASDVDVHLYRSMIGSLMYLTASRPDIMFAVCACSRFQVTPKTSHLSAVKRIFRYLKGKPKLGLWYPRVSSFDLESYSDSDYAGANLDRKSTTGEAEYVAAASCCGQVLWIQNQMLDYGFNFMNTKIYIDNESTICIVKNPVYHSKTKHIAIRHHFIRDAYEKKLIQVLKIHTDDNVADLLTKAFDVSRESLRRVFDGTEALLLPTLFILWLATGSTDSANLVPIGKHNMVAYLETTDGNAEFHEIIDFLTRSSIHHALTLFTSMLVQPTEDEGAPSERPSEAQPTPSPPHTSEAPVEPQTDLSPRPSPSTTIPDSIPESFRSSQGNSTIEGTDQEAQEASQTCSKHTQQSMEEDVSLEARLRRKEILKKHWIQRESRIQHRGGKSAKGAQMGRIRRCRVEEKENAEEVT